MYVSFLLGESTWYRDDSWAAVQRPCLDISYRKATIGAQIPERQQVENSQGTVKLVTVRHDCMYLFNWMESCVFGMSSSEVAF